MKKIPIYIRAALLLPVVALYAVCAGGTGKERLFRSIEFRGLEYLSKYEIIRQVRAANTGKGILLDMDSLDSVLKGSTMIEDYSVSARGESLTVTVKEKKPVLAAAVTGGETVVLLEFDDSYSLISKGRIYGDSGPLFVIGRDDVRRGVLSGRVKELHGLCAWAGEKLPDLYRELAQVTPEASGTMLVKLRRRRTLFSMKADRAGMERLSCAVGYLDRMKYYPERLDISGNMIMIREPL